MAFFYELKWKTWYNLVGSVCMDFPIQRSKLGIIFVSITLAFMVMYPIVMFFTRKVDWASALIGMGLCFIVNVPLVWEMFIKKHKVENGILKYGILNDDVVLKDIKVVRQVGKSFEITTNSYKVHMIAMPQDMTSFLSLIEKENPHVKIEMVGKR
jgi:hypothetical protein